MDIMTGLGTRGYVGTRYIPRYLACMRAQYYLLTILWFWGKVSNNGLFKEFG